MATVLVTPIAEQSRLDVWLQVAKDSMEAAIA